MLKSLELFAGAGGLALGTELAGFRVHRNKRPESPTGLWLISDAHDGLPAGLEVAGYG